MTALQVIIKEAKAIRSKNPKMEWKKAVAQASAIYASKHKGKSPVGKKKVVKKAAKKTAKKKIGYSKTRLKTEKGITKYLKSEPKTLFPYTQEEKIIKAGKKYFDDKTKELHKKGVSGVKKYTKSQLLKLANNAAYATGGDLDKMEYRLLNNHKLIPVYEKYIKDFEIKYNTKLSGVKKKVGAVKKSATTMHKDTKSHNVNIKVMSGVGASSFALYNNVSDHIDKAKKHIIYAENHILRLKQFGTSPTAKKSIKMWKEYIKEQKTHITQLKKHI